MCGDLVGDFFSFSGRVRRCTFWVNTLVCGVITLILFAVFVRVSVSSSDFSSSIVITNKPIYYLASFLVGIRALSVSVRRWHDLDKSGWWALTGLLGYARLLFPGVTTGQVIILLLVGILALYALGMQGFVPGDHGPNEYGDAPEEGQWF
jgi:uncharacterized membrane protein YhaH (DUF805 family)